MCMSAKTPTPPPPPPAPKEAPTRANESVQNKKNEAQLKARNLQGDRSTQLTGPRGLMAPAATAGATLMGG